LLLCCSNDTQGLNGSLKFPDLTEAKYLDTLEYSVNHDDLDFSKLEKESHKFLQDKCEENEEGLEKYLIKSPDADTEIRGHSKNQESLFTLSNNDNLRGNANLPHHRKTHSKSKAQLDKCHTEGNKNTTINLKQSYEKYVIS